MYDKIEARENELLDRMEQLEDTDQTGTEEYKRIVKELSEIEAFWATEFF